MALTPHIQICPASVPREPGCLSILIGVAEGPALQALGKVPDKLRGAKWSDVYSWQTMIWQDGCLWTCQELLHTESPAPWSLNQLREHFCRHNKMWEKLV